MSQTSESESEGDVFHLDPIPTSEIVYTDSGDTYDAKDFNISTESGKPYDYTCNIHKKSYILVYCLLILLCIALFISLLPLNYKCPDDKFKYHLNIKQYKKFNEYNNTYAHIKGELLLNNRLINTNFSYIIHNTDNIVNNSLSLYKSCLIFNYKEKRLYIDQTYYLDLPLLRYNNKIFTAWIIFVLVTLFLLSICVYSGFQLMAKKPKVI